MTVGAGADVNTYVSTPSGPIPPVAAPGGQGAGAQMGVDKAAIVFIGVTAASYVALRLVLRGSSKEIPPLKIDALGAIGVFMAYQTLNIPLKLLAYKYYGHQAAQAYILLA